MAYYLRGFTNCKTYEEAVDKVHSIPPQIPLSIHQYEDGEFCISELTDKPVQKGQAEFVGEVILSDKFK